MCIVRGGPQSCIMKYELAASASRGVGPTSVSPYIRLEARNSNIYNESQNCLSEV